MSNGKSLREYVQEGMMIFVAVTIGFFADNYRDELGNRDAERSYMHALLDDIAIDSLRLVDNITRLSNDMANADTMVLEYIAGRASRRWAPTISLHGRNSGNSIDLVFNDRTSSQLKGTGAMRLVRDTAIASGLLRYWNNQDRLREIRDRFEISRVEHRKVGWRAFNWYQGVWARYGPKDPVILSDAPPAFLDASLIPEFVNTTSSMYNLAAAMFLPELNAEMALGSELRRRIRQAYP